MDQDGFIMNVNTNIDKSKDIKKSGLIKKLEKKNKYQEKKLLNKKRERNIKEKEIKNLNSEKNKEKENFKERDKEKIFNNKNQQNTQKIKKNFLDFNSNLNHNYNLNDNHNENYNEKETEENKYNNNNKNNNYTLELNENNNNNKEIKIEGKNKNTNLNFEKENFGIKKSDNPNNDNDEMIDELNEYYEKKEKLNEKNEKRLTSDDRQRNKIKIKTMINEINKEYEEITKNSEVKNEEKNKEIDYKSSVFSIKDFQDLDISPYLKKVLQKENFSIMTKVQKKSIPILLKHRDVVVKSETGSGKTLAYVIPIYDFLIAQNINQKITRKDGVFVVVFAPTHELCLQIESTFDKLKSCCISAVFGSLMGGQSIETEKSRLRKGLNVIITTPGRLLYHLNNTTTINFTTLKMLVFDEADILLNMGFEKDIKECMRQIHNKFNGYSQDMVAKMSNDDLTENKNFIVDKIENLNSENFKKFKIFLISATIDYKIRKMAEFLMKGFKSVGFEMKNDKDKNKEKNNLSKAKGENIDNNNNDNYDDEEEDALTFSAPVNLTQEYCIVFDEFRLMHLICQIFNNIDKKLIVFVNNCDTVNFLQEFLEMFEFNTEHIIKDGEYGVGFNKYKDKSNSTNNNINNKGPRSKSSNRQKGNEANNEYGLDGKNNNNNNNNKSGNLNGSTTGKLIKLINTPVLKLHGKMKHEERKKIFKKFNEDNAGKIKYKYKYRNLNKDRYNIKYKNTITY
jgi:superfamily II DNA/RNA helicase